MFANRLVAQTIKLLSDNAPTILTALGVTGTVTTAYLTGRASVKAVDMIREEEVNHEAMEWGKLTPKEKFLLTWKEFIPAVGVGALTISCIIGVNRIGMRRTAALAAAYSLSEKAFDEYKAKVRERLGDSQERRVRDDIAQDQVNRNPLSRNEVILSGNGDVLCYDSITGRYFLSQMETLRRSMNDVNHQVLTQGYASLYNFFELVGLASTPYSHEVGWNMDELMDISFSAVLAEDGRPCMSINYNISPIRKYHTIM